MSAGRRSRRTAGDSPSAPAPLAGVLGELARRRGWDERLRDAAIHQHWEEIAGSELAQRATPVRLHGGVLVIRAETAAWAGQLRYLVGDLQRRANEVLGENRVQQVRVVTDSPGHTTRSGP